MTLPLVLELKTALKVPEPHPRHFWSETSIWRQISETNGGWYARTPLAIPTFKEAKF